MASASSASKFPRPEAHRVLVVANPSAGSQSRQRLIEQLLACLEARGLTPHRVSDLATLPDLTAKLLESGELRAVVAGGGDGTIAEVVNRTTAEVPISVFPLGTANLLAKYLGLSLDANALADTLAAGATARIDAGVANGRVFVLVAGCGFDADVVERLHQLRSGGNSSYFKWAIPIWHAIRSYDYPRLRVYCEDGAGQSQELPAAHWAFVVNLPPYAGGLSFAPEAIGSDGLLDACTFGRGSLWHGLRYLSYVWLARHHALADYKSLRVRRVRIESDRKVPYQLDGDPGGHLPLEIEVLPARLTLLAERERLTALGLTPDGQPGGQAS